MSLPGCGYSLEQPDDRSAESSVQAKGKAKETAGEATDNQQWRAEGKADQGKSNVKQAGEKIKDAAKDVLGK